MSVSKPQQERKSGVFPASSAFNTPILTERFDRFCTNCAGVIENLALEKYSNQKCSRCFHEVDFVDKADGLYRRCVKCFVMLRCDFKFCDMCGRNNQFYDPTKPARLEKAMYLRFRERVARENENSKLSQTCVDDGDFSENASQDETTTQVESKTDEVDTENENPTV